MTLDDIQIDSLLEPAVEIDVNDVDNQSIKDSLRIVKDMAALYEDNYDKMNPQLRNRLSVELESLRGLIKMRIADERVHDALLNGISADNQNASLYRALAEIQRTSLAVTKQINDTLTNIKQLLQGYQLELNFDKKEEPEEPKDTHRGSRAFIKEQIGGTH